MDMATDVAHRVAKSDQRGAVSKSQSCTNDLPPSSLLGCSCFLLWPQRLRKLGTAWEVDSSSGRTERHTSSWPTGCEACSSMDQTERHISSWATACGARSSLGRREQDPPSWATVQAAAPPSALVIEHKATTGYAQGKSEFSFPPILPQSSGEIAPSAKAFLPRLVN